MYPNLLLHYAQVSPSQRQMAICLPLSAPRSLWPEPPRPASGRVPPQARPQLVRQRAELVMQNRWDKLATLLLPTDAPSLPSSPLPSPQRLGLVTGPSAHKLMQAAKHWRLSAAWRQLFSYRLAPPTVETKATLESKWRPPQPDYRSLSAACAICDLLGRCCRATCHTRPQSGDGLRSWARCSGMDLRGMESSFSSS